MRRLVAVLGLLALVLAGGDVGASVEAETGYSKVQTYNAALRYLRVDLAYDVTEKDEEAGYLLFRFVPDDQKKPTNGSIEIVEQRYGVRVYVRMPERPRYQEEVLSDGLLQKLRDEYGDPPPEKDAPPPDRKRDRDKDDPDGGGG